MKKTIFSMLALMASLTIWADDKVLMTVDGEPIMASEFEYIYHKNNQDQQVEQKSIDEYLTLFTNFRLKVHEAEVQKLDTSAAFKKELAGYRAQATGTYMKDQAAIDSLVYMTWQRQCKDRRAAHIAIQCPADAAPEAQAEALAKINDIRERVTIGKEVKKGKGKRAKMVRVKEDFYDVAAAESNDPNAKETRGELGWITVMRYVYPFEEAVYNTAVGEVSEVFRSGFGYHIALVEEEVDHIEVKASHIMKMAPEGDATKVAEAKTKIDALYESLKAGADFAATAKVESDDRGSATRGGELGWFGRGQMVQPFEDAVFAMTDSGAICAPVQTRYGWHIIQMEGKRGQVPFESVKDELGKRITRDARYQEADKSFVRKLRAEYKLPETMSDKEVKEYADKHLEEKYDEFRMLVKEYHDGILLFDVSLKEVWDKAPQDKEGLKAFFQKNRKNYTWDEPKYKGFVLECKNAKVAKAAKAIIKSAEKDSVESYINQRLNLDSTTYVKVTYGMWTKGQNAAVDKFGFKDKAAEYTANEEYPVVECIGKVLKNPAEWSDERTKVVTDYQDYLEGIWVEGLKAKYPVVIHQDVFAEIKAKE